MPPVTAICVQDEVSVSTHINSPFVIRNTADVRNEAVKSKSQFSAGVTIHAPVTAQRQCHLRLLHGREETSEQFSNLFTEKYLPTSSTE